MSIDIGHFAFHFVYNTVLVFLGVFLALKLNGRGKR